MFPEVCILLVAFPCRDQPLDKRSSAHLLPSVDVLQDRLIPQLVWGSVTSRRGTGMLLDVSCCLSMNCQRPRVERSGAKAAILPGA